MSSSAITPVFPVGLHRFRFHCSNKNVEVILQQAWLPEPVSDSCETVDLDVDALLAHYALATGTELAALSFDELASVAVDATRQAMSDQHARLLYCHGAALVRPDNANVLLVGLSFAGKTTLSLGLCFRDKWRMLVEDIVYFDNGTVVRMRHPLSVREPSFELLANCGAQLPAPLIDRWVVAPTLYAEQPKALSFDLAIVLQEPVGGPLNCRPVTVGELLRSMLARSNALHFDGGTDELYRYIEKARCYHLQGGDVEQRCDLLSAL